MILMMVMMMHRVEAVVLYTVHSDKTYRYCPSQHHEQLYVIQTLIIDFLFYKIDITITYLIQYI